MLSGTHEEPWTYTASRVVIALGILVSFVLMAVCYENGRAEEAKLWREAARPVFKSRGTYDITDHATPENLAHYLDPHYAVVWQEHVNTYR